MNIIFITRPTKLTGLNIRITNIFDFDNANPSCHYNKIVNEHIIHYLYDCDGEENNSERLGQVTEKLNDLINTGNYIIIHHSNQHENITDIVNGAGQAYVEKGTHDANRDISKWYKYLPEITNNAERLEEFLSHFGRKKKLNLALDLLHDIYSGKTKKEFCSVFNKIVPSDGENGVRTAYEDLTGKDNNKEWNYDHSEEKEKNLAAFRDKLLAFATKNNQ